MFISGKIIKNKNFPPCLCEGPRVIPPPLKYAGRKRHAKKLNKMQSGWHEEAAKVCFILSLFIYELELRHRIENNKIPNSSFVCFRNDC